MKKRLAFLTAALALVCMVQAQPFRFGGNGEFTVMQLTDRSGATVPEALLVHAIPEVVSAEAPWG